MAGLTVADVMTKDVISVQPTTPYKEIARVLSDNEISAVPVVGPDSKPVGVISEADLLLKLPWEGGRRKPGFFATAAARLRFRKAEARSAGDAMTPEVKTIQAHVKLPVAAHRLLAGKLRRLFVVDDGGRLVGVLARRDVVRVFTRSDEELAEAVRRDVLRFALWAAPEEVTVTVTGGEAKLEGELDRRSDVEWAGKLTEQVPGVVTVDNRIEFRLDDIAAKA